MINKVILVGNLGKDAEVLYTTSGTAVATLSVATEERWTDDKGNPMKRTEWHRIKAWGKLAELAGKLYSKGKQVYLEGQLQTQKWTDKNGIDRWTTEIKANTMRLLGAAPASAPPAPPVEDDKYAGMSPELAAKHRAIDAEIARENAIAEAATVGDIPF